MRIKKLEIKNYKNIKEATIDFDDLTIFIGKNNIGKSNLLNALDLFFNWNNSKDFNESLAGGGNGNNLEYKTNLKDYRLFFGQKPKDIELIGVICKNMGN
ncbi:MAG: AAA family ATPase, partial [Candidatus Aenigmarchaeota archaeon]|nr:AAA family ATPase [Candidatus Aenigmarchaeota archaeon]